MNQISRCTDHAFSTWLNRPGSCAFLFVPDFRLQARGDDVARLQPSLGLLMQAGGRRFEVPQSDVLPGGLVVGPDRQIYGDSPAVTRVNHQKPAPPPLPPSSVSLHHDLYSAGHGIPRYPFTPARFDQSQMVRSVDRYCSVSEFLACRLMGLLMLGKQLNASLNF